MQSVWDGSNVLKLLDVPYIVKMQEIAIITINFPLKYVSGYFFFLPELKYFLTNSPATDKVVNNNSNNRIIIV